MAKKPKAIFQMGDRVMNPKHDYGYRLYGLIEIACAIGFFVTVFFIWVGTP